MVPKNLMSGAILRTHVISSQLWTLCLNLYKQWLLQRKPRYSKTYIKTYCEFIVSFLNSLLLGLLPLSHLLADHPLVLDAVAGKNRRGGLQRSWLLMVCCLWSHSWSTVMCYCNRMSPPLYRWGFEASEDCVACLCHAVNFIVQPGSDPTCV